MDKDGGKNTIQSKCEDYVIQLLGEFEGVDIDIQNVSKEYYLYDRVDWVKVDEKRDGYENISDTDDETIKTLILQKVLFKQIIHSENGKILNRNKKQILDGVKDVRYRRR